MKPRILFIRTCWAGNKYRLKRDTYGGIGYYRIIKPAELLKDEYDITVIGKGYDSLGNTLEQRLERIFKNYDLIFTKPIESAKLTSAFLFCSQHYGIPIIQDLDDNLLNVKEDNPHYNEYKSDSQRVIMIKTGLGLFSGLTVSTEPLKKVYLKYNKNIDVLPNFNDVNDWPIKPVKQGKKFVIGYAGSTTHDSDIVSIIEPLKEIFKKYPHVDFEVQGGVELLGPFEEAFAPYQDRVHAVGGSMGWDKYNETLAQRNWDIAIAPLVDDEFTRCKSHIKWTEMTMMGWPVIASKTYPYYKKVLGLKTITHGKTGFLCKNSKDWIKYLSLLIEDIELRKELWYNAYKYICENWQWNQHKDIYKKVFDKYLQR